MNNALKIALGALLISNSHCITPADSVQNLALAGCIGVGTGCVGGATAECAQSVISKILIGAAESSIRNMIVDKYVPGGEDNTSQKIARLSSGLSFSLVQYKMKTYNTDPALQSENKPLDIAKASGIGFCTGAAAAAIKESGDSFLKKMAIDFGEGWVRNDLTQHLSGSAVGPAAQLGSCIGSLALGFVKDKYWPKGQN